MFTCSQPLQQIRTGRHPLRKEASVPPHSSSHSPSTNTTTATSGYTDETKRLYGVLQIRLKGRDYLAGPGRGKFTIADANAWGWVNVHAYSGIESLDEWPDVKVSSNGL